MSIKTEGAGFFGGVALPFPLGSKMSSDNTELEKLLGMVVEGPRGRKFRLVKYVEATALAGPSAAGTDVAGARLFAVASADLDDPTATCFYVTRAQRTGTKPLNRTIGAALKDQVALVQNDYFWLQFDGDYLDLWLGDDNTDVAVGDYVALDDDTDLGCIYGLGTTFTVEFLIGVAMDANTGVDAIVRVRPYKPLNG